MSIIFRHTKKDLLFGVNQQDHNAIFVDIYKKYWQKLYAIAYNRLHSKQSAEDVVQEVMTSLWQRREEVSIKNLEAWLSAATRYSVFRQLAKFGQQTIVPLADQPDQGYEPLTDLHFLEKMIRDNIHRLPEKCKLVFKYSRQHGMTNKEIAGELAISEKMVEKHITKAITRLRRVLKVFIAPLGILILKFFHS